MSLSGKWKANNGNVDIFIVQTGEVFVVNWTEPNPYWNFAAGVVAGNNVRISFGGDGGTQTHGQLSGDRIKWANGSSWSRA